MGLLFLKSVFALFSHLEDYFHHGWLKNLVILRRNKKGQEERTDLVLFKIHNPVVRIKCYAKIALKNKRLKL